MRYINHTLLNDEQVVYLKHPHWIVLTPAIATLMIASLLYTFSPAVGPLNPIIFGFSVYVLIAILCALIGIVTFIKAFIVYRYSEYAITNKRILMKTGLLERNALEIFLDKIEAIHIDQTIPGRILNYGSVLVIGTGGSRDPFLNVPAPLLFRKMVQQEIDNATPKHL